MGDTARDLEAFLERHPDCALVEVAEARGSTPREAGAWMLVAKGACFGTVGGGQLEWMAIDEARRVLVAHDGASPPLRLGLTPEPPLPPTGGAEGRSVRRSRLPSAPPRGGRGGRRRRTERGLAPAEDGSLALDEMALLDILLGPEIGQCCGGRVTLGIRRVDETLRRQLAREARDAEARRPHVYLLGGGHVGHALAAALAPLPVRAAVVETRGEALEGLPAGVGAVLTAVPEALVRAAPAGSAFVILTHDHALDFLLAAEALKRGDAGYVGMIGSATKRATFRRWFREEAGGTEAQFARLICPIGDAAVKDKRPAVIAALAAAEIIAALAGAGAPQQTVVRVRAKAGR